MIRFRSTVTMLVTLAALAFSSVSSAQGTDAAANDESARNHFRAGSDYYAQGRYAEATNEFLEAYRLSGRVELLLNASRAAERNLEFRQAIDLVDQFLAQAPADHAQRATETARRESLVQLEARMASQPRPTTDTPPPDEPEVTEPEEPSRSLTGIGYTGIGLMGGGVAFGAISLATGIVADHRYDDLRASCDAGACGPEAQSDIDSGRRLARLSTAATFIGIGSAVAGVVLVIIDPRKIEEPPTAGLHVVPGPGQAGLGLGWSF